MNMLSSLRELQQSVNLSKLSFYCMTEQRTKFWKIHWSSSLKWLQFSWEKDIFLR